VYVKVILFALVLLVTVAEARTPRVQLWTAFERSALRGAKLDGVRLEPGERLRATLEPGETRGTLETAPITGDFDTAVPSWNALTPTGSGVRLELRARFGARWSRYYAMGTWSTDPDLERTSVGGQKDTDGRVSTDTLNLVRRADAVQLRVTLEGRGATLTGLGVVLSDSTQHERLINLAVDRVAWGKELNVPTMSQMVYPGGGEVWCSPTSVTMILRYWDAKNGSSTAQSVPDAARAMWDTKYDGSGNWSFNAAYAGSRGYRAYIHRLSSLNEAQRFIARGVPLALSIGWDLGTLRGAHIARSEGHLVVLRGFTKTGNPIINDPAARSDAGVRTIYDRTELERAWITHSGGIVYVIEPN
jgi:hypothetical protein